MNLKLMAAATAALSLAGISTASAQTVYMTDTAYIEPAPAYVTPTPGYGYFPGDYVQPQVTVVAPQMVAPVTPPQFTVQSGPRYHYNSGYYGIAYAPALSCSIDAFGNRLCE